MSPNRRVALLVDTSTGYSSRLIQGVAQYARAHQCWELLIQPRGAREIWRIPRHWQPDGVIARVTRQSQARELRKLKVPVVNVSRSIVPGPHFPQVAIDERMIGIWAADHLMERGFRRFGYCGLTTQAHYTDTCGPAFRQQLAGRGFGCRSFRSASLGGSARAEPTIAEMKHWLRSLVGPVAIFATAIEDAFALTEACWASNLRVPDAAAILCGEDDPLLCSISNPPISCIDPGSMRVGYQAADQLDRLLSGAMTPRTPQLVPPLRVVTRRSTDTVAVEDQDLASAIRIIRELATTPIDVTDVLRQVPIARRGLEKRFKQFLGRSPAAEIRRLRIERAKELLTETDWKMPRIAAASGFTHTEVMNQVFRRELNLTPTEYRRSSRLRGDSRGSQIPGTPPTARWTE